MSNVIPDEWEWNKVSQFTEEHKQGYYTRDPYTSEGKYLIRITDLFNPRVDYKHMPKLEVEEKEFSQFKVEVGDFLFARSGAIGRYGIVEKDFPAVFASYLIRFRFDNEQVLTRYFGYIYESDLCQYQLGAITQGSSNININADNIKSLSVPLPSLPEQQKIATILSSVDDVIEKTQAQIDKLKDLKTGMVQELLTKGVCDENGKRHTEFKDSPVGRIPVGWEVVLHSELCDWVGVGIASSTTHAYTDKGVALLRNQNILPNGIRRTDVLYITEEFSEENASKKIQEGDVLTVRTGYPGVSAVVPKEFDGCHSFTTLISRPRKEMIDSDYMSMLINSDYGRDFVAGGQAGGAQQNLNVAILRTFPVIVPPIEEQKKIFESVEAISKKIRLVEKKKKQIESTKRALMQDLLTGKVRVKVDPL